MRRSGSYNRFVTLGQTAECTDTPLPRVIYPTIDSPRIGLQHLARTTMRSSTPRTLILSSLEAAERRAAEVDGTGSIGFSFSWSCGTTRVTIFRGWTLPY